MIFYLSLLTSPLACGPSTSLWHTLWQAIPLKLRQWQRSHTHSTACKRGITTISRIYCHKINETLSHYHTTKCKAPVRHMECDICIWSSLISCYVYISLNKFWKWIIHQSFTPKATERDWEVTICQDMGMYFGLWIQILYVLNSLFFLIICWMLVFNNRLHQRWRLKS